MRSRISKVKVKLKKSPHPHVHTPPWQRQWWKQAKMTHKHVQAKANTDKLCETKQNQHYSPINKKQHNLDVWFEPFPLLEFSPPLESCSDIYAGPTSCLIVTLLFNVLFLWYFPLFFCHLYLSIVDLLISDLCTNWALSSLYQYKTHPLTADWLQVCFGTPSDTAVKSVFEKSLVHV